MTRLQQAGRCSWQMPSTTCCAPSGLALCKHTLHPPFLYRHATVLSRGVKHQAIVCCFEMRLQRSVCRRKCVASLLGVTGGAVDPTYRRSDEYLFHCNNAVCFLTARAATSAVELCPSHNTLTVSDTQHTVHAEFKGPDALTEGQSRSHSYLLGSVQSVKVQLKSYPALQPAHHCPSWGHSTCWPLSSSSLVAGPCWLPLTCCSWC